MPDFEDKCILAHLTENRTQIINNVVTKIPEPFN